MMDDSWAVDFMMDAVSFWG